MPLACSSSPEVSHAPSDRILRERRDIPESQGPEGQFLAQVTEKVWRGQVIRYEKLPEPAVPSEDPDYRPIPPNRSFIVRVRYRWCGRGQPLEHE